MHGLFVHDMVHVSTSEKLKQDFIAECDFQITCDDLTTSFLCMEVEQDKNSICLHLDYYIQDTLSEYKAAIKKFVKPKQVPMQPGVVLEHDQCPETQIRASKRCTVPLDQMQPCFHCFTASKILHISRTTAMGSSAPRDGILGDKLQLQADALQGGNLRTGRICRLGLR